MCLKKCVLKTQNLIQRLHLQEDGVDILFPLPTATYEDSKRKQTGQGLWNPNNDMVVNFLSFLFVSFRVNL